MFVQSLSNTMVNSQISFPTGRRVLHEVVQKLKKYSKEGQKNFEDAVGKLSQLCDTRNTVNPEIFVVEIFS